MGGRGVCAIVLHAERAGTKKNAPRPPGVTAPRPGPRSPGHSPGAAFRLRGSWPGPSCLGPVRSEGRQPARSGERCAPPRRTGQPIPPPSRLEWPANRRTPPAVVATGGVRIPCVAPAPAQALNRRQALRRPPRGPRSASRSSASRSRCTTSSLRIRSSRAWLAVRQSGSLSALVRSAWACSCSAGGIRRGSAILSPSTDPSGAAGGSWLMTSTTSTKPKAARSRRRAASWSSSISATRP